MFFPPHWGHPALPPDPDPYDFSESADSNRKTWPPTGSAKLTVEDVYQPMFFSATWVIVAKVGNLVFHKSAESNQAHSADFVKRWAKQLIRVNYKALRGLGVDAGAEYVALGGDLADLLQYA